MPVTLIVAPAADANGYVSLEAFKAHCAQKLRDVSTYSDDQLRAKIIEASEYMDVRHRYYGYRSEKGQEREFPRRDLLDVRGDLIADNVIPKPVENACCEYAFRGLTVSLLPDPSADASGMIVKQKDEKVGPISESVTYETINGVVLPTFPLPDRILYASGLVVRAPGGLSVTTVGRA